MNVELTEHGRHTLAAAALRHRVKGGSYAAALRHVVRVKGYGPVVKLLADEIEDVGIGVLELPPRTTGRPGDPRLTMLSRASGYKRALSKVFEWPVVTSRQTDPLDGVEFITFSRAEYDEEATRYATMLIEAGIHPAELPEMLVRTECSRCEKEVFSAEVDGSGRCSECQS